MHRPRNCSQNNTVPIQEAAATRVQGDQYAAEQAARKGKAQANRRSWRATASWLRFAAPMACSPVPAPEPSATRDDCSAPWAVPADMSFVHRLPSIKCPSPRGSAMSSTTVQDRRDQCLSEAQGDAKPESPSWASRRMSAAASGIVIMPMPKLRILKGPMSKLADCM